MLNLFFACLHTHSSRRSLRARLRMCCCALTQVQGEVDRIGILDTIVHGLALPPRGLLTPVEVCQEAGIVAQVWVWRVTMVARACWARLHAVVLRWGTADVWRHHSTIERDVLKLGHAAAWVALVVAGVHCSPDKEVAVEVKREQKAQKRRAHRKGWIHVYKKFHSHLHPKQTLSCTLRRRHKCMKTLTWEKLSKKVQTERPSALSVWNLQHMFPLCGVEWCSCRKSFNQGQHDTDRGGPGVGVGAKG